MIKEIKEEVLMNGAEVWFRCGAVVLAYWNREFVIWTTDKEGNAFWGHYNTSLKDAMQVFSKKTGVNMTGLTIGDIGTNF